MPSISGAQPEGFEKISAFAVPDLKVPVTERVEIVFHPPVGGNDTVTGVDPLKLMSAERGDESPFA